MNKYIFLVLLVFCSFSNDNTWRVINNKLYSISIPPKWEPMPGMPENGINPGERDINGFHIFYWGWSSPIKSKEDFPKTIGIDIQSYQKSDNEILAMEEIEELEMSLVLSSTSIKTINIWPKKDQKRFFIVKNSKEMNGEIVQYRVYYLFQKNNNIVHCVKISLRNDLAEQSDISKEIKRILDSFSINKTV